MSGGGWFVPLSVAGEALARTARTADPPSDSRVEFACGALRRSAAFRELRHLEPLLDEPDDLDDADKDAT